MLLASLVPAAAAVALAPRPAHAAWANDASGGNVPVCTAANIQEHARIVSDGAGGAIVIWDDDRDVTNTSYDVYGQRLDATGTTVWTTDGAPVCNLGLEQMYPAALSDGAGGTIVTWRDQRGGIYAQRVDATGTLQWYFRGVSLGGVANWGPVMVSDGAGGAILAWLDTRNAPGSRPYYDVYAQRISAEGKPLWAYGGVPVCTAPNFQQAVNMIADGSGGAILTWSDRRDSVTFGDDIYAQKIDASGAPQWTVNGVPICATYGGQGNPELVSDGAGGAIIGWNDGREVAAGNYTHFTTYAQRVDASGATQWASNGVLVADHSRDNVALVADGAGGAIFAWGDPRSGLDLDLYVQRLSPAGSEMWTPGGELLCNASGDQQSPTIVADDAGGAIVAWPDGRNGTDADIYAQRVDGSGAPQWSANGVGVCTAPADQAQLASIADGSGGAIVTWEDQRNPSSPDLYAQRIDHSGTLGLAPQKLGPGSHPTTILALAPAHPNPARQAATLSFALPQAARVSLRIYDPNGRFVRELAGGSFAAGPHELGWDLHDQAGRAVGGGVYFARLDAGGVERSIRFSVLR